MTAAHLAQSSRPSEETNDPPVRMMEHLAELRKRLLVCLGAIALAACVGFGVAERVIGWLKRPAGNLIDQLAFFSPTEAFVAYVKVSLACGMVLALPVVLYQIWAFVQSGLKRQERVYGGVFIWCGSGLFVLGMAFAYVVLLPVFLRFLLTFGSAHVVPVLSISRYLSFVLSNLLLCGVLFELPLVVFLLSRLGIVTARGLRRRRGLALLAMLIVVAFITPTTDALNMLLMTMPLIVLYELSILIARFSSPHR